MNNGNDNNTLESGIEFEFPPMKKERSYLNNLVLRCIISLALAWMLISSADPEMQELVNEAGAIAIFLGFFIVYLVAVSIIESLALLVIDTVKGFLK